MNHPQRQSRTQHLVCSEWSLIRTPRTTIFSLKGRFRKQNGPKSRDDTFWMTPTLTRRNRLATDGSNSSCIISRLTCDNCGCSLAMTICMAAIKMKTKKANVSKSYNQESSRCNPSRIYFSHATSQSSSSQSKNG